MDFSQRDMTYGGYLLSTCKTSDLKEDLRMQVAEIFNENEYVVDSKAVDKSEYITYLTIPKTSQVIGYCLYTVHYELPAFLKKDIDITYEKITVPCIYINQIAMGKKYAGKGYAMAMYDSLIRTYRMPVYSHVCITNKNSMKFHFRTGFKPVGEFVCENFHGICNYFSFLLKRSEHCNIAKYDKFRQAKERKELEYLH